MLYLVHFEEPYCHARHYLGFVEQDTDMALETRLDYHRRGQGSRLLAVVTAAGIDWRVVRTWPGGTRSDERRLKGHSSTRYCPECRGEAALTRGLLRPALQPV